MPVSPMSDSKDKRVWLASVDEHADIKQEIEAGFKWIGWEDLVDRDARVFIKPNLTFPSHLPGVTTSPRVIEAVIAALKERTSNITVGESNGGYHSFEAEEAFEKHGIYEIADRYSAQVVNLSKTAQEIVKMRVGSKDVEINLPSLLLHDVDVFITLPVPKIHAMTGVSLGFKNQWGCNPSTMRLREHSKFNEKIVAINKVLNPKIVVYDGTYFLDKNGPMKGEPVRMDLLMVANDIGAGDFVGCQIMGVDPFSIGHLSAAYKAEMLPSSLSQVAINADIQSFVKREFRLERNLLNWIALPAFHSSLLTTIMYDSEIGKLLHNLFYAIRKISIIRRLLYGQFAPPTEKENSQK